MAKNKENFLDYIPVVSDKNDFSTNEDGKVTIHMVHKGFYAFIAQKLFSKPRVSHIDLDTMGSFIFSKIDGEKTIGEIAEIFKEKFGEKAEPLYERLIRYIQILKNNEFIYYKGKK